MLLCSILRCVKTVMILLFLLHEVLQLLLLCFFYFSFLPSWSRESFVLQSFTCCLSDWSFHVGVGYCSAKRWVVLIHCSLYCSIIGLLFPTTPSPATYQKAILSFLPLSTIDYNVNLLSYWGNPNTKFQGQPIVLKVKENSRVSIFLAA